MAKAGHQKKTGLDLLIILIATFLVLGTYMGLQSQFKTYINTKGIHILLRVAVMAFLQFGVAGLGSSIVCVIRKESFQSHGLLRKGALLSIVCSVLAFIPNILFNLATGQLKSYLPFQTVWMTKEVLASGFPVNVLGMGLITAAWGFFEGFNYVVICNKLNAIFPSSKKWLNWGAILCGVMCLLIHGMIGVTPSAILEAVSVFIIIYGMLVAKELTGSAWGCVFIFIFLWNAF
jgi:hypothetical protein